LPNQNGGHLKENWGISG